MKQIKDVPIFHGAKADLKLDLTTFTYRTTRSALGSGRVDNNTSGFQ